MSAATATVRNNRRATPTTRLVAIEPDDGGFEYLSGQWAMLGLTADTAKPYSIASPPGKDPALEFLIREDGSGIDLAQARRGTRVYLEGPHGRFVLPQDFSGAEDAVFIAGGTGIAPIRAMLLDAWRRPRPRRSTLVYSARDSGEFAFLPELRKAARNGLLSLSLIATRRAPSRWKGSSGRLSATILAAAIRQRDPLCFVCGPESFVSEVTTRLTEMGVKRVRTEEQG